MVLAFGLSSAPYLFTKCLRPIVKYWRENGVDIVLYLDDGLGMGKNKQEASECSSFVKTSLLEAGFLINREKSIFEPVQCLEWLGLVWNSSDFSISISDRRIENTLASLVDVLNNFPYFTARKLAQVTGKVISMCPVMGNITSLMTRYLHWAIESRVKWDLNLKLECPDCVFNELTFWLNNILRLNRKHLAGYSFPHVVVYSDASNVAAGAYSIDIDSNIFHQMWTLQESIQSSTWRELQAILLALMSFKNRLRNKCVKWHTDNNNCVFIVQKGSSKVHLQEIAMNIFKLCSELNITLEVVWIPRSENTKADYISKMIDIEDWGTSIEFFKFIDDMWGPHTVDRFANYIFRSMYLCKKSKSYKLRGLKPLSYTRVREIILSALESIGLDKSKFGLHSLRSGGATAAASAGIQDRLFKKHGRWASDKAKDGYIVFDCVTVTVYNCAIV
ncbi:uncharacterized protein LOC134722924 [Mytilus trossulus]|uniref:uncharacterized protein LOC134722924 n=1 Tax=Mytilus trossulus TaxID=6551 RepID=UPI0030049D4D